MTFPLEGGFAIAALLRGSAGRPASPISGIGARCAGLFDEGPLRRLIEAASDSHGDGISQPDLARLGLGAPRILLLWGSCD